MRRPGLNPKQSPVLLIGAGRMGGALLTGWLKAGLAPIVAIEPSPSAALRALARKNKALTIAASLDAAPDRARAVIVAIKPQVLKTEAARLKHLAAAAPMISIAAGTSVASLRRAWGSRARIVRAMPNTPGAIGRGITGLYAAPGCTRADRALADMLLAALGETVWVGREALIDAVTAVSGSGPAYVFLMAEALADAGRKAGLSPDMARKLARATVSGAGALLDVEDAPAADLRRAVTSPGGTTEAALKVLMAKDGLTPLMTRAVAAAKRRARELR